MNCYCKAVYHEIASKVKSVDFSEFILKSGEADSSKYCDDWYKVFNRQ